MSVPDLNPFVHDKPLLPEDLIDREAEAAKLLALAEGGHNTRLSAPRRYGKTSLAGKVIADAERLGMAAVAVDFYGVLTLEDVVHRIERAYRKSLQGPLKRLAVSLLRALRPAGRVGVPGVGVEVSPAMDEELSRLLDGLLDLPVRIFEKSGGTRTLVVFDEFQDLLAVPGKPDALLRSHIQHHRREASYIFCGSHPGLMAQLFGSADRPFFGQARAMELGPLEDADIAEYAGVRFERTGRDASRVIEPLLDLVRGHPQRAMLVAHHLWEHTPRGEAADETTWESATEAVFGELREAFEQTWKGFGDIERRTLAIVASGAEPLLGKRALARYSLARTSAAEARDRLIREGHLMVQDSRPILVDPLFERWLAERNGEDLDEPAG